MDDDKNNIVEQNSLELSTKNIIDSCMTEEDPDKLKQITQLFNNNLTKKNMIRSLKLSGLLDTLDKEVSNRITNDSDRISDRDLINYMNTIQNQIQVGTNQVNNPQVPFVAQQNININVDKDFISKESRDRILEFVNSVLESSDSPDTIIDADFTSKK